MPGGHSSAMGRGHLWEMPELREVGLAKYYEGSFNSTAVGEADM